MLKNKKILIAVSGGIAAYKTPMLVRALVKIGAEVKVVLSPSAKDFVTPLTLATVSKNVVYSDFADNKTGQWANHIELGLWADYMVVAPATANTIAKMATGLCDNLLMAVYLSARCPVFFAPAMDLDMYKHATTQQNIATLLKHGSILIKPVNGELASGLVGEGRMEEPENIAAFIDKYTSANLPLAGKKALVTAGPTYEAIDPVRFIGNHSSGKMGFAIAEQLANAGAEVTLVCGPNALPSAKHIKRLDVVSADEMKIACEQNHAANNIFVFAAAVADYKPINAATKKIKKGDGLNTIELAETTDIAAHLGKLKKPEQLYVGFALETDNEDANAVKKLKNKNLDFIVLNSLNDKGAGFKTDTNKIKIIDRHNKTTNFELKDKRQVAQDIVNYIIQFKK
jgi:phosphopantothenoylcysteine decarboxylase/phosphopantothenate--cysteine ligase